MYVVLVVFIVIGLLFFVIYFSLSGCYRYFVLGGCRLDFRGGS